MCLEFYGIKNVKVTEVQKKVLILLSVIFMFFMVSNVSAQILVAGTSFDPINPANANTRAFIGMNEIKQVGVQTGAIEVVPPITPSTNPNIFNSTFYHAVTDTPYVLDNARYNKTTGPQDYQLVISPTAAQTTLLTYRVANLQPGSNVRVEVTYCSAIAPTYAGCTTGEIVSLRGVVNPDQYNTKNGLEGTQVSAGGATAGGCTTMNITQATSNSNPIGADGSMTFYLNTQQTGTCKAVAIKSIMIYGTPQPAAVIAEGSDICTGEQITLQTSQDYNGTYQWETSTTSATSGFSAIAGATGKTHIYEVTTSGTRYFRVVITPTQGGSPIPSTAATMTSTVCCLQGGQPATKQTVYYDNFGRLDLSVTAGTKYFVWDYSNPLSPVEVAKTTATPFRWTSTPAPLGATFKATGPPIDGEYVVAAGLTGYNSYQGYTGARLEWAKDITGPTTTTDPGFDHSGKFDGGVLLLNCPPNTGGQPLYERTITGLCPKQLFFECWIAVFTNAASGTYNGVDVAIRLTEIGGTATAFVPSVKANRQASGGGVWVKASTSITLTTGNSLKFEIINNQNVSVDGNDLALDDIKISACAPPPIEAFFTGNAISTAICNQTSLPMFTIPTTMLKNYYGGTPSYLFQWTRTPNDYTSWTNLGSPVSGSSGETYTLNNPRTQPPFSGLTNGGKVYFRVIATTPVMFASKSNFQGVGNHANINDPCKNYSVSEAIEAEINCPLPVTLISFNAIKSGNSNLITWSTASEKNNRYFAVERSVDGKEFAEIGIVAGNGTTDGINSYQFSDPANNYGITYYRLKQVDYDGKYDYSKTVAINVLSSDFSVYPNPNSGNFSVSIFAPDQSYTLDLVDAQGKVVYSITGEEVAETIEVSNIPSGFYLVRLTTDSQLITKKLVVH